MDNKSVNSTMAKPSLIKNITSMREFSILLFLILVCVIMSFASPVFATKETVINTLYNVSTQGILVIGMTVALISGGFDLSIGSVVGLVGAVTAKLFLNGHLNEWLAAGIAMVIALAIGSANGFFITRLRLSPFITTLATMGIARGAIYVVSRGTTQSLVSMSPTFLSIGKGTLGLIPHIGIIFIVFAILFDILLRRSKIFRKVYYTGSNEKAARMSGINTRKITFLVYVFVAGVAGMAGILSLMRFGIAAPTYGTGMELTVISAAVIGGCSLNGGEGSVFGSVLGIILLGIVSTSMTLLGISVFWQQLITSLILLIAVSLDSINEIVKGNRLAVMD